MRNKYQVDDEKAGVNVPEKPKEQEQKPKEEEKKKETGAKEEEKKEEEEKEEDAPRRGKAHKGAKRFLPDRAVRGGGGGAERKPDKEEIDEYNVHPSYT